MPRNPPWTRDELILALDLYFRNGGRLPSQDEVDDLSRTLRSLADATIVDGSSFRNANGVHMKLGNFQALDPRYTRSGKVGLKQGGRGDREVWEDYAVRPAHLHEVAAAIRSGVARPFPRVDDADDEIAEATEGRLLTRLHSYRERNAGLRSKKVRSVLKVKGALRCEICDFDFEAAYGERGRGFMEVHHLSPLHELIETRVTRMEDLALVCANCHRMIHAKRPWLTLAETRALLVRA